LRKSYLKEKVDAGRQDNAPYHQLSWPSALQILQCF